MDIADVADITDLEYDSNTRTNPTPGVAILGNQPGNAIFQAALVSSGFKIITTVDQNELVGLNETSKIDTVLLDPKIDIVVIACSSPALAGLIAVKTLGIGKNVVCLKSLAGICQDEVLKAVEASSYYPKLFSISGFSLRLLPSIVAAKLQVESGVLGKVKLVDAKLSCSNEFLRNAEFHDWRHDRRMNGGILSQYA